MHMKKNLKIVIIVIGELSITFMTIKTGLINFWLKKEKKKWILNLLKNVMGNKKDYLLSILKNPVIITFW